VGIDSRRAARYDELDRQRLHDLAALQMAATDGGYDDPSRLDFRLPHESAALAGAAGPSSRADVGAAD
jgi:hypothetical protein